MNFWIKNFSINNITPKYNPQMTKFQAAPCHKPVNAHTIKIFLINLNLLTLFPPNGI